jgi:polyhydroxyalkanoate synthesis regulator protein
MMIDVHAAMPVAIRLYGRARLYDPAAGCYRTLAELRQWRASGIAFTVIDAETGEDVTRALLA